MFVDVMWFVLFFLHVCFVFGVCVSCFSMF